MFCRTDLGTRFLIAAASLALSVVFVEADEANWVDRYIEGNGACDQPLTIYQPQPLGLPLDEWTDGDIAKLKSALERCEAKSQRERHWHLEWLRPVYEAVVGDVQAHRRYAARQQAQVEARRFQAQQIELAKQHQATAQERERRAEEDEAIAARKTEDVRTAEAIAARQERDRVLEQAKLANVQAQSRRDREAADRAKTLADQEAPHIREVEKEASEAQRARLDAERRLDEVRKQARTTEERRDAEDAAVHTAKARRVEAERQVAEKEREAREDRALAKTCAVSAEQFGRIALGMHLREVRQAFGCVGSLDTSSEVQGLGVFSVYQWDGAKSGTAAVTTFNNDTLVSKSQNALD